MFTIENDILKVSINAKGAELKSIFHKQHQLEYMWNADPKYWAKTSPVLFPIVGTLKDDTYYYNEVEYKLSRHGFARDKTFEVREQSNYSITFSLLFTQETLQVYPFEFRFDIAYTITENEVAVTYTVNNLGQHDMYFSVGAHPAFKVPLVDGTSYNDYSLIFNKEENAGRWPISADGLIERAPQNLLQHTNTLPLTKQLFAKDALVLKGLQSTSVKLASSRTSHGLNFHFPHFPFLGLWAAPEADFVCIEPWCGIADSVDSNQQLKEKEGVNHLPANGTFNVSWRVEVY